MMSDQVTMHHQCMTVKEDQTCDIELKIAIHIHTIIEVVNMAMTTIIRTTALLHNITEMGQVEEDQKEEEEMGQVEMDMNQDRTET